MLPCQVHPIGAAHSSLSDGMLHARLRGSSKTVAYLQFARGNALRNTALAVPRPRQAKTSNERPFAQMYGPLLTYVGLPKGRRQRNQGLL